MTALAALALLLLAAAAQEAPTAVATARPPVRQDGCANPRPAAETSQIVICAPKPQGYRLNPDVTEAKRELRSGGRPPSPYQAPRPDCLTVGPAPCLSAGINLIGAALTAAEMARRLAEGKEIGSMFVTDPHPDEYHLYLAAKARREAREAEAEAKAAAKARAATAGESAPPQQQ